MSDKQGTFVWYELLTADVKKAIDFYGNVIGWGTQPFGESYNMWTAGKTPIGGVMGIDDAQMHAGTKPHWWAHVLAENVFESEIRFTVVKGHAEGLNHRCHYQYRPFWP